MKYQITSDNISLSPSMEVLAKTKFERIEKRSKNYPEDNNFSRIVLNSAPDGKFTVRANVKLDDKEYFTEETEFSLEGALIKIVEELLQMMEKDSIVQRRKDVKERKNLEELVNEGD
ncbi:hypothetical protein ACFL15_00120 [Patescibacteria group bacterium]